MKKQQSCQFCKKELPPGSLFYECRTRIISGFDGFLPQTKQSLESTVHEILRETEGKTAEELREDVYQEFCFILCNDCRLLLRERLQAMMCGKGKILSFAKAKGRVDT